MDALPPELLSQIASLLTLADWLSLALVSRSLNSLWSPFIYASISIRPNERGAKCLRSLLASPRNYPPHVTSFSVFNLLQGGQYDEHIVNFSPPAVAFVRVLPDILERMDNLRYLYLFDVRISPLILWKLAKRDGLRYLVLRNPRLDHFPPTTPDYEHTTMTFPPSPMEVNLPNLELLEIEGVGRSQKTFLTWSTQVLKAVSTQLEAVVTNKNTSDALIPRLDAKPHPRLRVLAVPIQSLDPSIFPNLPNLRILVLSPSTSPASAQSPPPLPFNPLSFAHFFTEHLPNLTHYIGPSTPNALLTALVAAPRRIQTLILDSPPYTYLPAHLLRQSRLEHFASSMAPPLHTYSSKLSGLMVLRPILSALPRPPTPSTPITRPWFPNPRDPSPVPCLCGNVLQDLRFRTNNSDLHLLSTIGPFVPNLRILSVWLDNGVPSWNIIQEFGQDLLSRLPHLHTFLLRGHLLAIPANHPLVLQLNGVNNQPDIGANVNGDIPANGHVNVIEENDGHPIHVHAPHANGNINAHVNNEAYAGQAGPGGQPEPTIWLEPPAYLPFLLRTCEQWSRHCPTLRSAAYSSKHAFMRGPCSDSSQSSEPLSTSETNTGSAKSDTETNEEELMNWREVTTEEEAKAWYARFQWRSGVPVMDFKLPAVDEVI